MKTNTKFRGITRYWWIPIITGIFAITLGIWTLVCPVESLPVLAYVFAGCLVAAGVLNLVYSIFTTGLASNWGWAMALGILDLIAGIWLFTLPVAELTVAFMFVVGIWLLVVVINSLCEACVMSSYSRDWVVWLVTILLATLILSLIFLSGPVTNGIAVWLWLGLSLITFGIYRIILGVKVKKINRATDGLI